MLDLSGSGDKTEVVVRSPIAGEKRLLLAWAPLGKLVDHDLVPVAPVTPARLPGVCCAAWAWAWVSVQATLASLADDLAAIHGDVLAITEEDPSG
ncbi:MAG: hypothetical protein R2789_19035 [Microthrixaceae bacterium]